MIVDYLARGPAKVIAYDVNFAAADTGKRSFGGAEMADHYHRELREHPSRRETLGQCPNRGTERQYQGRPNPAHPQPAATGSHGLLARVLARSGPKTTKPRSWSGVSQVPLRGFEPRFPP